MELEFIKYEKRDRLAFLLLPTGGNIRRQFSQSSFLDFGERKECDTAPEKRDERRKRQQATDPIFRGTDQRSSHEW